MKNAPPETPLVAGPELASDGGDEGLVQHAMHEPQRRVLVQQESRTIVVAEEAAPGGAADRETRKLEPYTASRAEKTVVIRDRRAIDGLRRAGIKGPRSLASVLLWVAAGLAAFGLGGAVAVMTTKRDPPPKAEPAIAPRKIAATPELPPPPATTRETEADSLEGPALNAAELPVEKNEPKVPAAASVRKPTVSRPPASAATAASPQKLPVTPQAKSEIPSGI